MSTSKNNRPSADPQFAPKNTPPRSAATTSSPSVMYDTSNRTLLFENVAQDPNVLNARLTLQLTKTVPRVARKAMASIRGRLSDEASRRLNSYDPPLPAEDVAHIRSFVSDSIALALPLTVYSVETLMGPVMRFVHWSVFVVGCELDATIIFDRDLIDTYVREALPDTMTSGTRRNYRAWILRVAEVVNPDRNPHPPIPLNSKGMETPYSARDLTALNRWSAGQPTQYRREGAATLVALGAGAGLSSIEITHLKADAVTLHNNGKVEMTVSAPGKNSRRVVVTAEFEDVISALVKVLPPDTFVFLPQRSRVENDVVSSFVSRTVRPAGSPTVTVRRLRNTWLVTQMTNRVDVLTLMEASGLQSLESISRLAQFVPRPSADERDAQLRGAS